MFFAVLVHHKKFSLVDSELDRAVYGHVGWFGPTPFQPFLRQVCMSLAFDQERLEDPVDSSFRTVCIAVLRT